MRSINLIDEIVNKNCRSNRLGFASQFGLNYVDVICHDMKKACHVGKNAIGYIDKVAGATRIELTTFPLNFSGTF
jgi:hypothetical protein